MPTLLGDLALGTAVVDDYSLKNQRRIYYSSSGQMELDEQPYSEIIKFGEIPIYLRGCAVE